MHPTLDFAERSVKLNEGFSKTAYPDPADGRMLIGYGFAAQVNEISQEVATLMVREKLAGIALALGTDYPHFRLLSPVRQAVLVEMAYQMGMAGLLAFDATLDYIANGEYHLAAAEMLDSKWAREDTPKRAKLLSDRFRADRFL